MGVLIRIAVRNLVQARRRSFFLGLALSLVTILLVTLLALSQGVSDTMIRAATTLSSGHVNVAGWFKAKPSDSAPLITNRTKLREIVEKNTPGLDFVVDRGRGWGRVISDTSSLNSGLTGVDVKEETRLLETLVVADPEEYSAENKSKLESDFLGLARHDGIVMFAAQAKKLEVAVGDYVTITVETMSGTRNTAEFQIVAVAKDIGMLSNWSVFMHKEGIRKLYALDADVTGAIEIHLEDHSKATEVMGHLREVLEKEGYDLMDHEPQAFFMKFETVGGEDWTGQKLDLTVWSDEVSYLQWILPLINSLSFLLLTILSVIIAIGIMNSMMMAVRERTTEVGTLRAIGMSRMRVLAMFMIEAIVLSVTSTVVGGLIGMLIAFGVDAAKIRVPGNVVRAILLSDTLHLVVEPGQLLVAVLAFSFLAGAAALLPALRAAYLQPVKAIQHAS